MAVERLRYFTGLFLEEQDFKLEQLYHLQMRRRLNFALFTPGVLFGLTVAREATDRVRVDPGMAVDSHQGEQQGHEIVLTGPRTVNLNAFANGAQVYITIAYGEQLTAPRPPLNIEARLTEDPLIETFLDTGAGFSQDKNLKIILAKVTVGNLSAPDVTERQLAQLRLAGGGPLGGPTVTSLTFNNLLHQGSPAVMTINGTNLGNNPQVTILTVDNNPDPQITATINAATSSNTVLTVNVMIASGAVVGNRRVRVQTDNGTVATNPEPPTAFVVVPPAPTITTIVPANGRRTVSLAVTITGTGLAANPVVTILQNDSTPDPNVTVTTGAGSAGGTSVAATLGIGAAAVPGGRRVQVQTDGGPVTSPADFFTVRRAPEIKTILPNEQAVGGSIVIRGSDIRDDALTSNQPATGTTVRFVDPNNPANSVAGVSPIVLSNVSASVGPQRVQVNVPPQGALPSLVNLTLEIEEATAASPQQFTFT